MARTPNRVKGVIDDLYVIPFRFGINAPGGAGITASFIGTQGDPMAVLSGTGGAYIKLTLGDDLRFPAFPTVVKNLKVNRGYEGIFRIEEVGASSGGREQDWPVSGALYFRVMSGSLPAAGNGQPGLAADATGSGPMVNGAAMTASVDIIVRKNTRTGG